MLLSRNVESFIKLTPTQVEFKTFPSKGRLTLSHMLTLESWCIPVLGWGVLCKRTLPNRLRIKARCYNIIIYTVCVEFENVMKVHTHKKKHSPKAGRNTQYTTDRVSKNVKRYYTCSI